MMAQIDEQAAARRASADAARDAALADANVVMRTAHGLYCVTDAFVQEVWLENQAAPGAALAVRSGDPILDVPGAP